VERSALSFLPQSSASDTTLRAYMNLRPEVKKRGWIFRALVHDAITYDVPLSEAEECIAVVSKAMQEAGEAMFPEVKWAVDGNYATDWSRTG
jgi:DNA polymerase I-like protein with 3'-5' exonuclease and polymerase domains